MFADREAFDQADTLRLASLAHLAEGDVAGALDLGMKAVQDLTGVLGPARRAGPEHLLELQQLGVLLTEVALAHCLREEQDQIAAPLRQALRHSGRVLHLVAAQRHAMTCCHGIGSSSGGVCEHEAPWDC